MARHAHGRAPTVLLVGSAQDDRVMYAEYLRIAEFHTVEINDTADALALAETADVIVTGVRVPGPFDGIELLRRLRADGRTKDKPIIVLTACTFQPDQQRAYSAGCDGFLPKPCLPDTLVSEIRRAMVNRSLPRFRRSGGTRARSKRIA
jgi:two-component system cell cycle response regulator DivK